VVYRQYDARALARASREPLKKFDSTRTAELRYPDGQARPIMRRPALPHVRSSPHSVRLVVIPVLRLCAISEKGTTTMLGPPGSLFTVEKSISGSARFVRPIALSTRAHASGGLAEVQRVLFQSLQRAKWQRPSDNTAGGQEVTRERRVLARSSRSGVRLVHRGLRHARSERGQSTAGPVVVVSRSATKEI
jgi:hypothetical protein